MALLGQAEFQSPSHAAANFVDFRRLDDQRRRNDETSSGRPRHHTKIEQAVLNLEADGIGLGFSLQRPVVGVAFQKIERRAETDTVVKLEFDAPLDSEFVDGQPLEVSPPVALTLRSPLDYQVLPR